MQFPFKPCQLFSSSSNLISISSSELSKQIKTIKQDRYRKLSDLITRMGTASAEAQNLKQIITTFDKFLGTNNRIYLKVEGNKVLGMLKVGERNLFYRDYIGNIKEIKPTCVLDFYVHESCQRAGIGKDIFEYFLKSQKKNASELAYDRPSEKLLGFLRKHYGLVKYIPQNNNYVIYNDYFNENKGKVKQTTPVVQNQQEIMNKSLRTNEFLKEKLSILSSLKRQSQSINQSGNISKNGFKNTSLNKSGRGQQYTVSSPWASTIPDNNLIFKTTSNQYGSHYTKK